MVCQMQDEMQVALNFILSYLYNKLPRTRVHLYGEELELAIQRKFESHWYPSEPNKGSAYRCIHINEVEIDPTFEMAAVRSGLDFHNDIKPHLPNPLSVWVDPGEVSYTISADDGKTGEVKILYKKSVTAHAHISKVLSPPQQQDYGVKFGFNPNAKDFLPKSPSNHQLVAQSEVNFFTDSNVNTMGFNNRPQKRLYTVNEFASTKFGSTKMKNCASYSEQATTPRPPPPSPMNPSTTNRPHSLGFAPTWDFNSALASPAEFSELDFPPAGNLRFFSKSSFDSSSSTSSSSDNLNSPTKPQYNDTVNVPNQWSPGNDFIESERMSEEYFINNIKGSIETWSQGNSNVQQHSFNGYDDGGISCQ